MANTRSAIKRVRSNERKHARNKVVRSGVRSRLRTAREAMAQGNTEATRKATLQAASTLDKAANKGVIHKRNAARRKSRLMKKLAALPQK